MAGDDASGTDSCVHRWLLSAPAGDITPGVCTLCGETREFSGASKTRPGGVWKKNGAQGNKTA